MHLYTKTFYSNLPVKSSLEAFMTEHTLTKCRSWALWNKSKKSNVFGLFSHKSVRIKKKVFNLTTGTSLRNSDKDSNEVWGALIIHRRQRRYWLNMRADFFALRKPDCSIWENRQVHAQNDVFNTHEEM